MFKKAEVRRQRAVVRDQISTDYADYTEYEKGITTNSGILEFKK